MQTQPTGPRVWLGSAGHVADVAAAARAGLHHDWITVTEPDTNNPLTLAALFWSAPPTPALWRKRSRFVNAVYIAFDQRGRCRYVGSVSRTSQKAVGDRLNEHLSHAFSGPQKRATWARLFVVGLATRLDLRQVRSVEARAAFLLGPADGASHPSNDATSTLDLTNS